MDLLSGLRKGDSSRGGRAEFKWEDVKEDKDRENYLGHSLMARVLPSPPHSFPPLVHLPHRYKSSHQCYISIRIPSFPRFSFLLFIFD